MNCYLARFVLFKGICWLEQQISLVLSLNSIFDMIMSDSRMPKWFGKTACSPENVIFWAQSVWKEQMFLMYEYGMIRNDSKKRLFISVSNKDIQKRSIFLQTVGENGAKQYLVCALLNFRRVWPPFSAG